MQLKPKVSERDHAKGNLKSDLIIVEYGDYQCPHCGTAHPVLEEMMKEFGHQIKFVSRNFPISEIHAYARMAAEAAEAAALQGKFWEMHDLIFEDQEHLHRNDLLNRAKTLGFSIDKFTKDVDDESIANKIDDDFESGIRSGVNGTPSFFVNEKKFDGGVTDLLQMIRNSVK